MSIWSQKSASIQKRTSPLKFDHFRWKIPNFTVSNLSTKLETGRWFLICTRWRSWRRSSGNHVTIRITKPNLNWLLIVFLTWRTLFIAWTPIFITVPDQNFEWSAFGGGDSFNVFYLVVVIHFTVRQSEMKWMVVIHSMCGSGGQPEYAAVSTPIAAIR